MEQEGNLFKNKFVDTNVADVREKDNLRKKAEFRQYMESEQTGIEDVNHPTSSVNNFLDESENIIGQINANAPLLTGGSFLNQSFMRNTSTAFNQGGSFSTANSLGIQLQENTADPNQRFVQEQTTVHDIDSSNRNQLLYPDQNHYKIELQRNFSNVVSVKIKGAEFPNSQQLIKETPVAQKNNLIYWQISEDLDANLEFITYVTTLTPGNYTETTLANEIENQMNSVLRVDGQLNNFTVTIDSVTDIVEFTSIGFTTVSNPFSFNEVLSGNITDITVTLTDHGLTVGQSFFIDNAVTIDGIDASIINTQHIVTEVVDADEFVFQVPLAATSTETAVGGASVRFGIGIQFKLLWSQDNTPALILGFPEEDTDFGFTIQNTEEAFKYFEIDGVTGIRLKINKIEASILSSNISNVRTTLPHQLSTGDRVFIFTDDTVPDGTTIEPYDHLYGLTTGDLTTQENNDRLVFIGRIADPAGLLVTVIDESTFSLPVSFVSITPIDTEIALVDDEDEQGDIVLRTTDTAIDLSGEEILYICSPQLSDNHTGYLVEGVDDVFMKIQIAGPSNSTIFNSYIGPGKIFYDAPLADMGELEFFFRSKDGELIEFNGKDHGFTLEITEAIQKIEGIGFSARIGART